MVDAAYFAASISPGSLIAMDRRMIGWIDIPLLFFLPSPSLSITSSAQEIRRPLPSRGAAPLNRKTGARIGEVSVGGCVWVCDVLVAPGPSWRIESCGARDVVAAMFAQLVSLANIFLFLGCVGLALSHT
jgi:hypothetical protein